MSVAQTGRGEFQGDESSWGQGTSDLLVFASLPLSDAENTDDQVFKVEKWGQSPCWSQT